MEKKAISIHELNKNYYDSNAEIYEKTSWYYFNKYKSAAVDNELQTCLSLIGKKRIKVLELGPGTGYLANKLLKYSKLSFDYTCIEHSQGMSAILATNVKNRFAGFKVINKSIDAEFIEKGFNEKFDLILGSSILHHLPDYENIIKQLKTITGKGGVIYFVREPIHKDECVKSTVIQEILSTIYNYIDRQLLKPSIKKVLWPEKKKQPNPEAIAVHMFKNGISMLPFLKLSDKDFKLINIRKYNRSPSSLLLYIQNKWFSFTRKDIFGNTLFSIIVRRV